MPPALPPFAGLSSLTPTPSLSSIFQRASHVSEEDEGSDPIHITTTTTTNESRVAVGGGGWRDVFSGLVNAMEKLKIGVGMRTSTEVSDTSMPSPSLSTSGSSEYDSFSNENENENENEHTEVDDEDTDGQDEAEAEDTSGGEGEDEDEDETKGDPVEEPVFMEEDRISQNSPFHSPSIQSITFDSPHSSLLTSNDETTSASNNPYSLDPVEGSTPSKRKSKRVTFASSPDVIPARRIPSTPIPHSKPSRSLSTSPPPPPAAPASSPAEDINPEPSISSSSLSQDQSNVCGKRKRSWVSLGEDEEEEDERERISDVLHLEITHSPRKRPRSENYLPPDSVSSRFGVGGAIGSGSDSRKERRRKEERERRKIIKASKSAKWLAFQNQGFALERPPARMGTRFFNEDSTFSSGHIGQISELGLSSWESISQFPLEARQRMTFPIHDDGPQCYQGPSPSRTVANLEAFASSTDIPDANPSSSKPNPTPSSSATTSTDSESKKPSQRPPRLRLTIKNPSTTKAKRSEAKVKAMIQQFSKGLGLSNGGTVVVKNEKKKKQEKKEKKKDRKRSPVETPARASRSPEGVDWRIEHEMRQLGRNLIKEEKRGPVEVIRPIARRHFSASQYPVFSQPQSRPSSPLVQVPGAAPASFF